MANRENIEKRVSGSGKVSYRARVEVKGCKRLSKTFSTKRRAEQWKQQMEVDLRENPHLRIAEAHKHTLSEVIDRYIRDVLPSKKRAEKWQLHQFLWWKAEIGDCHLANISPGLIGECRDKLSAEITVRGRKRSPSTVVRYLAALSHALSIAVKEWGWLDDSPMRRVSKPREPRGRVRFLSDDERKRLLFSCKESLNPFLYTVVVLALSTGMRQGEMMQLRWSHVDLEKGRILLEETKNGERRTVPIAGHALELLKKLGTKGRIDTTLLFPGKDPRKPMDLRFSWETALKVAGINDFRFHDLRHSAASELAMNGSPLIVIKELLGHKLSKTTDRYSHLAESYVANAVEKMNEKIFG